jgi:DNA modification methylase
MPKRRRTRLDGRTWLQYSISVWADIKKSPEEQALGHPALYPAELVRRLLACYFWEDWGVVLDPFVGTGSTLVAAAQAGLSGVGFEIVPRIAQIAHRRLTGIQLPLETQPRPPLTATLITAPQPLHFSPESQTLVVVQDDARRLGAYLEPATADILITSPPYWAIHTRDRSVDRKQARPYSDQPDDLGNIQDYATFLDQLSRVFQAAHTALKPGAYAIVNVMDLRSGARFLPYHADLIQRLQTIGFALQDIIIWHRGHEYNNLRPIGYPYKFIVNKVHEYLLIFQTEPTDAQRLP